MDLRARIESDRASFQGTILFDEPLAKHTYYRIGGNAPVLVQPKGLEDLRLVRAWIRETGTPYFVMGLGSNLLVGDEGIDALVVKVSKLDLGIEAIDETSVRTGASVSVSSFLRRASSEGWAGLEWMTGIPGCIGGVVCMNAGTHLGEAKDALRELRTFSLSGESESKTYGPGDFRFEYRKNLFLPKDEIILSATWSIRRDDPARVKALIDETLVRRKATQPLDYPSCGSVFKNPRDSGKRAWEVVEALGLRGHRIGGAQISEKHPNFIVNLGGAKAADVRALIDLVRARAQAEMGIEMVPEVIRVP